MPFTIARGATDSWLIEFTLNGEEPDLATARVYFLARIGSVEISKANELGGGSEDEIEVVAPGKYRVKFVHEDTIDVVTTRKGYCDSWIVFDDEKGYKEIVKRDTFEVTRVVRTEFPTAP